MFLFYFIILGNDSHTWVLIKYVIGYLKSSFQEEICEAILEHTISKPFGNLQFIFYFIQIHDHQISLHKYKFTGSFHSSSFERATPRVVKLKIKLGSKENMFSVRPNIKQQSAK